MEKEMRIEGNEAFIRRAVDAAMGWLIEKMTNRLRRAHDGAGSAFLRPLVSLPGDRRLRKRRCGRI